MHHLPVSVLLAICVLALSAPRADAANQPAFRHFTEAQKADLKRVSDYLNGLQSIKGSFMQVNPDGTLSQGMLYLQKPGRVRFEYRPPNPNLIIADGDLLAVENLKLKTIDRFPLIGSPLALLLSSDIDLTVNSHVTAVTHQPGFLLVTASAASGATKGDIIITFTDPGLELRQWEVMDGEGLKTTVVLNDLQTGASLSPELFVIHSLKQSPSPRN